MGEKNTGAGMLVWAGAIVAFLVPFVLYLGTLAPTVLPYDSGTLQTKSYVLGIGHPTGYPTFIMLGHLFTYLPFGDPAYRVNLSSAVFAALSCTFVYLGALRLVRPRRVPERASTSGILAAVAPALVAALAFAVGPALWSQAVVAEVYALNASLIGATLYALLLWRDTRRELHLLLAGFLIGLSMTAHMTSGVLIPAALVFTALVDRSVFRKPKMLLGATGAFLFGLLPYLYLPVRASMDPPMNYGDATTLEGLLFILTGGNFRGQMLAFGPAELPGRVQMYLGLLADQYPIALLLVALLGAACLLFEDRSGFALLSIFGFLSLAYALEYEIDDIAVYFVPSYLLAALFLAAGLAWLPAAILKLLRQPVSPQGAAVAVVLLPVLALLALHVTNVYSEVDRSSDLEARRLVESVAKEAEPDSTILGGRSLAVIPYMQLVEGRREDLRPVVVTRENVLPRLGTALEMGPVYLVRTDAGFAEGLEEAGYRLTPVAGDLYEVSRAGAE